MPNKGGVKSSGTTKSGKSKTKPKPGTKGKSKSGPGKIKLPFETAVKLILSPEEQKVFLKNPPDYLASKKLSVEDVLAASSSIKSIVGKNDACKFWW